MEVVVLLVAAVVVMAAGIRVGMLLAPRVERMVDRANRLDPVAEPATDPASADPPHEDADDRTD